MMDERPAVLARLQNILREVLDDETIVIGEKTLAADIPGWDSMAHINIVIAAEDEFKVHFSSADLARLRGDGQGIGALVDLIVERLPS